MLFQSQVFLLVFLPVTLVVWYGLAKTGANFVREWVLVGLSLVFYGWWDVRFVPLLIGQALVSWLIAQIYISTGKRYGSLIWIAIAANLSVLAFFKYWVFLAENLATLSGFPIPAMTVILPIGISFFTFEIISYLADLRWHAAPRYPLRRFFVFVSLFPRLIAGPIVRHHEIIPQLDLDPWRAGVAERISKGAVLLTIGLVKKVFIADKLAPIADSAFAKAASATPDFATSWTAAFAFSFQLLFDFSAYSEMAIGIAMMLGLFLPQNFNAPYMAVDLRDFWRRWHMTLSRFLRDYVYIPLGGSRHGVNQFIFATMITMGLCGLWHGAGWTFVVWGLAHGLGLLICRAWSEKAPDLPIPLSWAITFLFVVFSWVLFRAPEFATALNMYGGMLGAGGLGGVPPNLLLIGVAALISFVGPTSYVFVSERLKPRPAIAVLTAVVAVFVALEVGKGQPKSFIYFQF